MANPVAVFNAQKHLRVFRTIPSITDPEDANQAGYALPVLQRNISDRYRSGPL